MPGGDRTGPMGMGAMTGRGTGFCSGMDFFRNANAVPRGGFGMGPGRGIGFQRAHGGRGWRNQYYATGMPGWMRSGPNAEPASPDDKNALKQRSQILQAELEAIQKQLDDMD